MSRPYTKEEVRNRFIDHIIFLIDYWANLPNQSKRAVAQGVAFSILSTIDGANMGFPAMDLSMSPHPDDKNYCQDRGENWFEPGQVINDDVELHQVLCDRDKKKG